jgi:hypothetical protein
MKKTRSEKSRDTVPLKHAAVTGRKLWKYILWIIMFGGGGRGGGYNRHEMLYGLSKYFFLAGKLFKMSCDPDVI